MTITHGGWKANKEQGQSGTQALAEIRIPPYYASNYFAPNGYSSCNSPVAASAGARRTPVAPPPSHQRPNIEMQDFNETYSRQQQQAVGRVPPYNYRSEHGNIRNNMADGQEQPSRYRHRKFYDATWILPGLIYAILLIVFACLVPKNYDFSSTMWTRPGSDELLNWKGVLYASMPKKYMWFKLLGFFIVLSLLTESACYYAALAERHHERYLWAWRPLVSTVVMVLQAALMWAWLLDSP